MSNRIKNMSNEITNPNTDPEYIEESPDIVALKAYVAEKGLEGCQKGIIAMAFDLLVQVLFRMYGSSSYEKLVRKSEHINESIRFCTVVRQAASDAKWSTRTIQTVFATLKHILQLTTVNPNFINKLSLTESTIKNRDHSDFYLPSMYKQMDDENSIKTLVISWAQNIKENTRNTSSHSLRALMYFILNACLPALNLKCEDWETYNFATIISTDKLNKLHHDNKKKLHFVKLFVTYVLKLDVTNFDIKLSKVKLACDQSMTDLKQQDMSDKHRITVQELEKLYEQAAKQVKTELVYLLLMTTGMRVGGLVNIKTEHVAVVTSVDVTVKESGRTLEKGSKWFTFKMNERVRELVKLWLTEHRAALCSPYLFPGRGGATGHISTDTIRKMFKALCKAADLTGEHWHLHAVRRSFAHILLESGNSVEIVSKLMGHANTSTTEHFYLKETAAEVAERANIPWLKQKQEPKNIVPSFLADKTQDPQEQQEKEKKKRSRRMRRALIAKI